MAPYGDMSPVRGLHSGSGEGLHRSLAGKLLQVWCSNLITLFVACSFLITTPLHSMQLCRWAGVRYAQLRACVCTITEPHQQVDKNPLYENP